MSPQLQNQIQVLHRQAMDLAEEADLLRLKNGADAGKDLLRRSYWKEREAALAFANAQDLEPTRSVLLRSAASLALECGENLAATDLIGMALQGNPPAEIQSELLELRQQAETSKGIAPASHADFVEPLGMVKAFGEPDVTAAPLEEDEEDLEWE